MALKKRLGLGSLMRRKSCESARQGSLTRDTVLTARAKHKMFPQTAMLTHLTRTPLVEW